MGKLRPDPSPNPATVGSLSSTEKSSSELPFFGEENCLGRGGVDRKKKGKRDAQIRVGFLQDVA